MKLIKYPSKEQWTELLKRPALNTENLFDTVRSIINKVRTEGTFTYGGDPDTSIGQWAVEDNASTGNYAITLNDQKVIGEAEATILNDSLTQVIILMSQSLS